MAGRARLQLSQHLWLVAALVSACGAGGDAVPPGEPITRLAPGDTVPAIGRPAGYGGVLPCDGCDGIETTLVLEPDGSYRLRERHVGRGEPNTFVSVGRWQYYAADSLPRLTLFGPADGPRHFAVTGALTLEARSADGRPLAGDEPPTLRRISPPPQLGRTAQMRGEFRYLADAASIVDCASGRLFPVAGDSAYIRLERAQREHQLADGASILVQLHGLLESRPGMEEGTANETFVVDSFEVLPPAGGCEASRVRAQVAVGDWRLTVLDGVELPDLEAALQPSLRFVLSEPTMFGNAGCNRFTGRAVLRGLALQEAQLAITRRLCVDSLVNEREARYAELLSAGGWFRLEGTDLVFSHGGIERARFRRR